MNKASTYHHYGGAKFRVPFAEVTSPLHYTGEAIYSGFEAIATMFAKAFQSAARKARERKAISMLSELDDRTLADIGIHRSLILHVAKTTAANPGIDYRSVGQ